MRWKIVNETRAIMFNFSKPKKITLKTSLKSPPKPTKITKIEKTSEKQLWTDFMKIIQFRRVISLTQILI